MVWDGMGSLGMGRELRTGMDEKMETYSSASRHAAHT